MKPYGYSRADRRTCKYGCCTMKENHPAHKNIFSAPNRKTARQAGKKESCEQQGQDQD